MASRPCTVELSTLEDNHKTLVRQVCEFTVILQGLNELFLICGISSWVDINLHEIFRQLLEDGLINMIVHVYVSLQLNRRITQFSQLSLFCQKHQNMLS